MTAALRAAAEDCDGAPAGGAAPAGHTLIGSADSIRVVAPLGWQVPNPALLVAQRLGFAEGDEPAELMVSSIGGNNPQALLHDACLGISRGEHDVVLVTGAEAMYARALARRDPARPWLEWTSQPEGTPPAALFGVEKPGATELEMQRGVILPDPRLPAVRERSAGGQWLDAARAPRPHRRPVVPLQRGRGRQPECVDPHRPDARGDRHAGARQPDGVAPVHQALHGQHAGRPRSSFHGVLRGGRPRRRGARGALGLPPRRRRRQRSLVHLGATRAVPLPRHPPRRRRRARAGRARHRRHRLRRPLLLFPRRGADGGPRARARRRRP